MQPRQLANARRPKRLEPRPLVETLPRINIASLKIPTNWQTSIAPWISLKIPAISRLELSWNRALFHHDGGVQSFAIKRSPLPHGRKRHYFVCHCNRAVRFLYHWRGNLSCRFCANAVYASQAIGKHSRPILQAARLKRILNDTKYLPKTTINKLKARLAKLRANPCNALPKRIANHQTALPIHNYGIQGQPKR